MSLNRQIWQTRQYFLIKKLFNFLSIWVKKIFNFISIWVKIANELFSKPKRLPKWFIWIKTTWQPCTCLLDQEEIHESIKVYILLLFLEHIHELTKIAQFCRTNDFCNKKNAIWLSNSHNNNKCQRENVGDRFTLVNTTHVAWRNV